MLLSNFFSCIIYIFFPNIFGIEDVNTCKIFKNSEGLALWIKNNAYQKKEIY